MDSDEIDKIADRITSDYSHGSSAYDEARYARYANRARRFFLKHHKIKSYKFFKDYELNWNNSEIHFGEWLIMSHKWYDHGYYSLADFSERKARHYLKRLEVPENHRRYHRRRLMNRHSCNQGQPQPKQYRPTKDDWRLAYRVK